MSAKPPRHIQRYRNYKAKHPDKVVLLRLSHPFVHAAFDDDAVRLSDSCSVPAFDLVIGDTTIRAAYVNSAGIVTALGLLTEGNHNVAVIDDN